MSEVAAPRDPECGQRQELGEGGGGVGVDLRMALEVATSSQAAVRRGV